MLGYEPGSGEVPRELAAVPLPTRNPIHSSFDPWNGRVVYGIDHREAADIWLIRPKH